MKKISVVIALFALCFLVSCKSTNIKTLDKVRTYFDFPSEVKDDLYFPSSIEIDGKKVELSWEVTNDLILPDGKLNPDEVDCNALISVLATLNGESVKYNLLTVTVIGRIKPVYKITYELDGGECDNLVLSYKEGEKVVLPTPTKDGYIFRGWYEGPRLIEEVENKNYYLKAKWLQGTDVVDVSFSDEVIYVGTESYINVKGFSSPSLFDITSSDEDVAYVDEEYFLIGLKKGKTTLTFTLKEIPSIHGSIEVEVYNRIPMLYRDQTPILIGDDFEIHMSRYDDLSLFDISYDSDYLSYDGTKFKALNEGKTKVTYTLKEDITTYASYEITIYPIKPVLSISSLSMTVGGTTRFDVLNYEDESKLKVEINEDVASINGHLITATKRGDITITVSLIEDPTLSSSIKIHVMPVMPSLMLVNSDLLVGKKTYLYISNLDDLEDTNLDNYNIGTADSGIASASSNDFSIIGKSVGSTLITISNKNDPEIYQEIYVNVITTPVIFDEEKEVGEGKLYISHNNVDDFNGQIHAGMMDYFKVEGATDLTKYDWITSNTKVLAIFEDGRYIAISEGVATIMVTRKNNNEVVGKINIKVYGVADVDYESRLIAIATSQLGYVEGPNNDTKYGRWYGIPDGEWCAMFVSWCANQAGISTDIIPKYAACTVGRDWFESRGLFRYKEEYTPKAGDIIFFLSNGAGHTGIVINCIGNRVYTIEGNTSDMCAKRNYDLMYNKITGYGTPNYPPFSGTTTGGDTSGSTEGAGNSTH